jgi:hypothetical protein
VERLKNNKEYILFYLISLCIFVLFYKSFNYTLYSDEAAYLAESLNIARRIQESGFVGWLNLVFSFDEYTSTRFATIGAFWISIFGEDYKSAHLVSNGVYFLIFILSLVNIFQTKDSKIENLLKASYLVTIPIIAFSSLWYLKDISFIALSLLCFASFMRYENKRKTYSFIPFIFLLYLCFLVRPLFSMIYLVLPLILFEFSKGKEIFLKKCKTAGLVSIIYGLMFCLALFFVGSSVESYNFIYFSFLITVGYTLFSKYIKGRGINHSIVMSLLIVPLTLVFYPSLLRFIYSTLFTRVAIETTGVFNFSTMYLKFFNSIIGFNMLISLYFVKKYISISVKYWEKLLIGYYTGFAVIIFITIPEYDFRLLIPSYIIYMLFILSRITNLKVISLGIIINVITIGLLHNHPKFTKKIYGTELLFENLALEIGKRAIVNSTIEVIGGRAFTGNISKLTFYSETFNLNNTIKVISPRINIEEKIVLSNFVRTIGTQVLVLGPMKKEGDEPLNALYSDYLKGDLGHPFELITLRSGEKFLLLNKE